MRLARTSFWLAVGAAVLGFLPIPFAVFVTLPAASAAFVLGQIALTRHKHDPGVSRVKWAAVVGIILGGVTFFLSLVLHLAVLAIVVLFASSLHG